MSLTPINEVTKHKGGKGGLFGKIAGTVLGGAAGLIAGGPPGAVTGAGLGGQLGGMAGEVADPFKADTAQNLPLQRMADKPNVQLAQLADAQKALMSEPSLTLPQREELNQSVFVPTMSKLQNMKRG